MIEFQPTIPEKVAGQPGARRLTRREWVKKGIIPGMRAPKIHHQGCYRGDLPIPQQVWGSPPRRITKGIKLPANRQGTSDITR